MNREAIKRAVEEISRLLMEGEGQDMRGGPAGGVKVEIEKTGGGEECPMCAAGECTDPEHMSDEDSAGLAEMYGS